VWSMQTIITGSGTCAPMGNPLQVGSVTPDVTTAVTFCCVQ
jgi:hypothetical protein